MSDDQPKTLAEAQLDRSKSDPRLSLNRRAHLTHYWHTIEEARLQRAGATIAISELAKQCLDKPESRPTNNAEWGAFYSWERSEFARATVASEYAHLNSLTIVAMFSALDGLVEHLAPSFREVLIDHYFGPMLRKWSAENPGQLPPDPEQDDPEGFAKAKADFQKLVDEHKGFAPVAEAGAKRWEVRLKEVGLHAKGPIPLDLDQALREWCAIRNSIAHRGGRFDEEADKKSGGALRKTLGIAVGDYIRIDQRLYERYSSALCSYGHNVGRRLLNAGGVSESTLEDWAEPRWV